MKLLVYADPHWSVYSSILRSRGDRYSTRLHNLIQSVNWVEQYAVDTKCDGVVCLGDFFDKEVLNSEEITAISEIHWNKDVKHYMIVGNHEMGRGDLSYSSMHIFKQNGFLVVDKPTVISDTTDIYFIPYILESDRGSLVSYLGNAEKKKIVFSHNDISGIQMGKFISKSGFSVEEIESNCDLFVNGHLHNGEKIGKKIINLGNLTGQNFSEDGFRYKHNIMLLDTETLTYELIENPYALNFYKLDYSAYTKKCKKLKNAVITVSCSEQYADEVRNHIKSNPNVIESRIIVDRVAEQKTEHEDKETGATELNHLDKFAEYISANIGLSDIVSSELQEVCR